MVQHWCDRTEKPVFLSSNSKPPLCNQEDKQNGVHLDEHSNLVLWYLTHNQMQLLAHGALVSGAQGT
jgi:hypothetical protein